MPITPINFERNFQIWKYTVGHGQLLLRSTKSTDHPTRIDVLFKNVGAVHLPSSFNGLSITESSHAETSNLNVLDVSSLTRGHRKLFIVRGFDFIGYVVAGIVVWHEDEGEYHEQSYFAKDNLL